MQREEIPLLWAEGQGFHTEHLRGLGYIAHRTIFVHNIYRFALFAIGVRSGYMLHKEIRRICLAHTQTRYILLA